MLKTFALAAVLSPAIVGVARAERATGIDVSSWQGTIAQSSWNAVAASGVDFAFVRATRGGTTGDYNQNTGLGSLSRRYDDPTFANNMTRAKAAGILVGAYHFLRADVIAGNVEKAAAGAAPAVLFDYTNAALDEANHFLSVAQPYIQPGYLRPVLDIEAGDLRTAASLTGYAQAFSDRVYAVTGVRPIVYANTSYATSELQSSINAHDLWLARYLLSSSSDPTGTQVAAAAAQALTIAPPTPSGYANPYGVWGGTGGSPWDFWQYTDAGITPGIGGNVDQNVANGDVNFVRSFLVPEPTALAAVAAIGAALARRGRARERREGQPTRRRL